eukprot:1862901-Rhodomonas_salina.1
MNGDKVSGSTGYLPSGRDLEGRSGGEERENYEGRAEWRESKEGGERERGRQREGGRDRDCLLYTSDAADDM